MVSLVNTVVVMVVVIVMGMIMKLVVVVMVMVVLMMVDLVVASSWNVEVAVHRDPSGCIERSGANIGDKSSHRLPAAYQL